MRVVGQDRVIAPVDRVWDSFFDAPLVPTDDFMQDRPDQRQPEREAL